MSCKCGIEIGDYSHCFLHGDGTEWAKRQELPMKCNHVFNGLVCSVCWPPLGSLELPPTGASKIMPTLESIAAELKELRDAVSKGQTENNSRGDYWRERALRVEAELKEQIRLKMNYFDQVQEILALKRVAEARAETAENKLKEAEFNACWDAAEIMSLGARQGHGLLIALNALMKIRGASRTDDLPMAASDALSRIHYVVPPESWGGAK